MTRACDVAVIGAGMAGLAAAVAALEQGATVIVLEKGAEPGGSAALAGGYVWSYTSADAYRAGVPRGDAALGTLVAEDFETGTEWLVEHGGRFEPRIEDFTPDDKSAASDAIAYRFSPDPVSGGLLPLVRAVEAEGGTLLTGTAAAGLATDDSGAVTGVRARGETIAAAAVVLATGGFTANLELMTRYVSPYADRFLVRSAPTNTGDGLLLGLAAGASASRGLRAFYGHLMPAPPADIEPGAFRRLSQFYSPHTLLLNLEGRRFTDESQGDPVSTIALARQPDATGFLVFDADTHRTHVCQPYVHDAVATDPLVAVREVGGTVVESGSLAGLADALRAHGVPAAVATGTLRAYAEAASSGDAAALDVLRAKHLHALDTPPFYAVPVVPGATFTEGGLRVDRECRVLDRDASPIPGLFAAGADVGGISCIGYAGGLSVALTTGLRAGVHAGLAALER